MIVVGQRPPHDGLSVDMRRALALVHLFTAVRQYVAYHQGYNDALDRVWWAAMKSGIAA